MDKLIVMFENEDKALNISLYEYVDALYKYAQRFIICHVTKEEHEIMLDQLKYGCLNERLPRITKNEYGYNKFRYMMTYNAYDDNILFNNYNDENQKGSYIFKKDKIDFNKRVIPFPEDVIAQRYIGGIKVYTTESFEDVIAYYQGLQKTTQDLEKAKIKQL